MATNALQYVDQIVSTLNQTTESGGSSSSNGNKFSVDWFLNAVSSNDNSSNNTNNEQTSYTIKNVLKLIGKLIAKFLGKKEAPAATQEVNQERTDVNNTNNKIDESRQNIEKSLGDFNEQANIQTQIIESSKEKLDADNEKLQEEQEAVTALLQEIEMQKAALLQAQNDPEAAEQILVQIQENSAALNAHITTINEIKADIEVLTALTATAFVDMETAKDEAIKVQEKEQDNINQAVGETQRESAEVAQTEATAPINTATSEGAAVAGEAASTNYITATKAPKLFNISADQGSAGSTRYAGAASVLPKLQTGIGNLTNNTSLLGQFANAVGMADSDFSSLIGEFNSVIEPTITSLGTYTNLADQKERLDEAVTNDIQLVENAGVNINNLSKSDFSMSGNDANEKYYGGAGSKANGIESSKQNNLFTFETPTVELTLG